jgi:hypothetical protein
LLLFFLTFQAQASGPANGGKIHFDGLQFNGVIPSHMEMAAGGMGDHEIPWTTTATKYSYCLHKNPQYPQCGFGLLNTMEKVCTFKNYPELLFQILCPLI